MRQGVALAREMIGSRLQHVAVPVPTPRADRKQWLAGVVDHRFRRPPLTLGRDLDEPLSTATTAHEGEDIDRLAAKAGFEPSVD